VGDNCGVVELPPSCDIAIVGAGAAGLATAIFVRRFNPSLSVVLLEGARKPGAKILVSGGGRCNVTNTSVSERDFWGGRSAIVRRVLGAFSSADTIDFFRQLGIVLKEEENGKLFPDTNRARDVLNALLSGVEAAGATLCDGHRVLDVVPAENGFQIVTPRNELRASRVVLATGGQSLPKTGSDGAGYEIARRLGHTIVETTPALVPLLLDGDAGREPFHPGLSGVSQNAELAIWIDGAIAHRLRGAILWTHFGASGPAAMNASRHWLHAVREGRPVRVTVSFCPGEPFDAVEARLARGVARAPKSSIQTLVATMVPASVAAAIVARLSIDGRAPLAHLARGDRRSLARALTEWPLGVVGTRGYNYAEATAGGVDLGEIDPGTLQSRACPDLFLVGEILDVDGQIGGFNFQWAWASAFVAGRALATGAGRG
jgi:hypothetical protein